MKRREFIKGSCMGLAASLIPCSRHLTAVTPPGKEKYDLVAVRGGEAEAMFERAISELGGIEAFVKKGQKVVVKPNIGWDAPPARAADTNPGLVAHIIKSCLQAGAGEVAVFDHTCDAWEGCYKNSQIEEFARKAGAKVIPGNNESFYREVTIPGGKSLKTAKVHQALLDADVFINVPILKHHSSTIVTLSMKNLMGVVWDRRYYHRNDLSQCIADFLTFRAPDLNIVDGYRMLARNGPRGVSESDVVDLKALIAGRDIVAVDSAATLMFGKEPQEINHIKIANDMGLGTMNLENVSISRIKMS
ncbi:DUF362 domain-containing protein [candidate division KSB1 bacterium]|nr:MAG: DUF362 domain-containing protein [candidate division KSB1 bacterium]